MNRLFKLWAALTVLTLVSACGFTNPLIVKETEYIFVRPDSKQLSLCYSGADTTPPLDVDKYLQQEWSGKEKMMFESNLAYIAALKVCDNKFQSLQGWYDEQEKLHIKKKK